ncbi:hypothetical protein HN51_018563 [Arachis hypogaea]|uniref:Uncharacterized protein LOC107460952 isoform X1 n=1 Tax=Arachis duranensis TaxID=130453 RepID=A0A6P4B6W0_ARADU|nr:uncharacterized protein LOC107460952 isoform X1 [Arachis duranensis]XP_025613210.1 uncharacterized protein LOC112706238 isoform X1 [Arachis hypogaea]
MKTRSVSSAEKGKGKQTATATEIATEPVVALGDLIYIPLRGASKWWPAQVTDEKSVNENLRPKKKLLREVLVRVYGSYIYKYVDPVKSRADFENVLKKNNGDLHKILQDSLEKDLPSNKPKSKESPAKNKGGSSSSKRKSAPKDEKQDEAKSQKQNEEDPESTTPFRKSQELSKRRIRVMESLGLIAPPGSPFVRNGHYS